ncbi:MAG: Rieske 2Fe-2S domain-containing protein, partial [Rhodospirillales bacterium]
MFVRNAWYVAAMGEEVGRDILARRILDQPLVLYRTGDGTAVALDDCCAHRGLPLSLGRLKGDLIECGYHGLAYDRTGLCVRVPGQTAVPPGACVRGYPLVEKWGWLWIWMGEAALADEAAIPDFHWLDDPGWRALGERIPVKCDYRYLVDNLLDLSHLSFVHETSIGVAAVAEAAEVRTERFGRDGVRITRWMYDCPPPPTYTRAAGLTTNIDRWQIIDFTAPSFITIDLGGKPVGTGAREGRRDNAI